MPNRGMERVFAGRAPTDPFFRSFSNPGDDVRSFAIPFLESRQGRRALDRRRRVGLGEAPGVSAAIAGTRAAV
jgi:hypothetical protein